MDYQKRMEEITAVDDDFDDEDTDNDDERSDGAPCTAAACAITSGIPHGGPLVQAQP